MAQFLFERGQLALARLDPGAGREHRVAQPLGLGRAARPGPRPLRSDARARLVRAAPALPAGRWTETTALASSASRRVGVGACRLGQREPLFGLRDRRPRRRWHAVRPSATRLRAASNDSRAARLAMRSSSQPVHQCRVLRLGLGQRPLRGFDVARAAMPVDQGAIVGAARRCRRRSSARAQAGRPRE